jgi:hypothetical protein
MPGKLRAHAEWAADQLQRSPVEISGAMRKHQLRLADRQCRMSELSARIQSLIIVLCTSLYAARKEDEIIRDAADLICTDMRRDFDNHRVTDREFRLATKLGGKIADGGVKSFITVVPDEIMMSYEK